VSVVLFGADALIARAYRFLSAFPS